MHPGLVVSLSLAWSFRYASLLGHATGLLAHASGLAYVDSGY